MSEPFTARDLRDIYFEVCGPGERISLHLLEREVARPDVGRPETIRAALELAKINSDVQLEGPGVLGAYYIKIGGK